MGDDNLEERVRELETGQAVQQERIDKVGEDADRLRSLMEEMFEEVKALRKQTDELHTLRRAIRWTVTIGISVASFAVATYEAWLKSKGG